MQHHEFEPPEPLIDSVKCFWHNVRESGEQQTSFEVIPDCYAEIIFHFGGDCSISIEGTLKPLPSPFIIGLLNQPITFYSKNRFEIISIRCFPWTVFDLLGLPADKTALHTFEHPIAELQPRLKQMIQDGRVEEAVAEVEQCFLALRSQVAMDSMLFKAGLAMNAANGIISVSQVAEAAHATVRTLERKFKQSSAYTVKDVSGLMRFEQARNHLWGQPDANIAALAHELGYTDQSHLSREFKRYSGTTPSAFARKARKGKQIISDDFVAFVQA